MDPDSSKPRFGQQQMVINPSSDLYSKLMCGMFDGFVLTQGHRQAYFKATVDVVVTQLLRSQAGSS